MKKDSIQQKCHERIDMGEKPCVCNYCELKFIQLEKALRVFASSSGGACVPGGRGVEVRGQPLGSGGDPKVIPR